MKAASAQGPFYFVSSRPQESFLPWRRRRPQCEEARRISGRMRAAQAQARSPSLVNG
ncbi:hypothetical protein AX14_008742 [Amanita brunnescens Koide BX004]|nr:hypothetical protein AX14_008742 [Amanita brunnescens Koide BX004]